MVVFFQHHSVWKSNNKNIYTDDSCVKEDFNMLVLVLAVQYTGVEKKNYIMIHFCTGSFFFLEEELEVQFLKYKKGDEFSL